MSELDDLLTSIYERKGSAMCGSERLQETRWLWAWGNTRRA